LPTGFGLEVEARGDDSVEGFVELTDSDQPIATGLSSVHTTGNELVYRASVKPNLKQKAERSAGVVLADCEGTVIYTGAGR